MQSKSPEHNTWTGFTGPCDLPVTAIVGRTVLDRADSEVKYPLSIGR